jgi:hypothetical protein
VVTAIKYKHTSPFLILLRKIGKELGFNCHAFEISGEGVYLYYNGKKYGPIQGITASEDLIRNQINRIRAETAG